MNVASKELCEELSELSGWGFADEIKEQWSMNGAGEWFVDLALPHVFTGQIPAYPLGYLIRKLPTVIKGNYFNLVHSGNNRWLAMYGQSSTAVKTGQYGEAESAEDAAAKLCIELIKEGVIQV